LQYLARTYDTKHIFTFESEKQQVKADQWIAFAQGDLGQTTTTALKYYRFFPVRHAFPTAQSHREMLRLYSVLESALQGQDYLVEDKYSVADMACWTQVNASVFIGVGDLSRWPSLEAWCEKIEARAAVKKAMTVPFVTEYGNSAVTKMLAEGGEFAKANDQLQKALQNALENH
jgi:glutathione S-transferase